MEKMETDEELDKEQEEYKKSLNVITTFLNYFDKDYEVRAWESGEGVDIIVKELELNNDEWIKYTQTLSLTNWGYFTFEKQENEKSI